MSAQTQLTIYQNQTPVPLDQEIKKITYLSENEVNLFRNLQTHYSKSQNLIELVIKIRDFRNRLFFFSENHAFYFDNSSTTSNEEMFITQKKVHIVKGVAGKGSQSTVYFTTAIANDTSTPQTQILKHSKESFARQIEILNTINQDSSTKNPNIDHIQDTYHLLGLDDSEKVGLDDSEKVMCEGYIAICNPSDSDLSHVDYNLILIEVDFILKQLIDIADGISSFHKADIVLRDIKGANFLCNLNGGHGKVTDFGFAKRLVPGEVNHNVDCTNMYVAPYVFKSIIGQKYPAVLKGEQIDSGGFQGKAADVFAFGRTLQLDVINRLLRQLGKKLGSSMNLFVDDLLCPKLIIGEYSNEDLIEYESRYPGRVFYQKLPSNKARIHLFKPLEEIYDDTIKGIQRLSEKGLSQREYLMFQRLASLAKELQNPKKKELLQFLGVSFENKGDALIQSVRKVLVNILETNSPEKPFNIKENSNSAKANLGCNIKKQKNNNSFFLLTKQQKHAKSI